MPAHLRRYDQPGDIHFWTISCFRRLGFFHLDAMKEVVLDGLRVLQERFGVCLIGYVVMPEHVHVILFPHRRDEDVPIPISKLFAAFKQHVGYYGKERLREHWKSHGGLWSEPLNRWARGEFGDQPIWNTRGYDFNVQLERTLHEKLDYCHKNPIARGLVDTAGQWPWSSFRFYEMGDRSKLEMDWDGRWPLAW